MRMNGTELMISQVILIIIIIIITIMIMIMIMIMMMITMMIMIIMLMMITTIIIVVVFFDNEILPNICALLSSPRLLLYHGTHEHLLDDEYLK